MHQAPPEITLRLVHDSDLPVFFRQANDPEAARVAAFVSPRSADWDLFQDHWQRMRTSPTVDLRTVLADGDVAGHVSVYGEPGEREVTYWIDRPSWGRGIATAALRALLAEVPERPLYARTAADNTGSRRVLEKCGFAVTAESSGFAHARGAEIPEYVLRLD